MRAQNNTANSLKTDLLICLFIGISFLWTGSEYITWWLYKLSPVFPVPASDLLSEGAGYLFQVFGLALFSFIVYKAQRFPSDSGRCLWKLALSPKAFMVYVAFDLLFTVFAYLSAAPVPILIFGMLLNLFHGIVAGWYLTRLSLQVSPNHVGIVFGFGYAFGSIGSYLLSNLCSDFLGTPFVFILYSVMCILLVFLDGVMPAFSVVSSTGSEPAENLPTGSMSSSLSMTAVIYACAVVFLLSFVKNIGFYFPTGDYISGAVNPILVRCFYGVGLIIAGIINDFSRRYGSVCCICSLVFPFLLLALGKAPAAGIAVWIIGYIFFGFFSVYRVAVFCDFSKQTRNLIHLAGFGLLFGRLGDLTSACTAVAIGDNITLLIIMTTLFFVGTILIFFRFYNRTYVTVLPMPQDANESFVRFTTRYDISLREAEVLRILTEGSSNSEIAAKLYISESTVKFHIRNILKKTDCKNRAELLQLYRSFQ